MCVCVFCSPPEPCVRYGVLLGERVVGEHRPRQERELDVHPERQHAGEAPLHRMGLLPAVSFMRSQRAQCLGAAISRVVACGAHLRPDTLFRYDHETQHAFVGDYSGQITLLKLEKQTYSTITTLKGHEGKDTPACALRIIHTALSFPPSRAESHLVSSQAGCLGNFCAQAGF